MRSHPDPLKNAAIFSACFLVGVYAAVWLLDGAERMPPKSFGWTWLFWAGIAMLLLANVALPFAYESGVRWIRSVLGRQERSALEE